MADAAKPQARGKFRTLTDAVLDGFDLKEIKCLSCSGYGNCGYKSYFINPAGGVASVCMRRRKQLQCKRDGIEYDDSLLVEEL